MDIVTKSQFEQFKNQFSLNTLSDSDAFELFVIYCVVSRYVKSDTVSKDLLNELNVGNGNASNILAVGVSLPTGLLLLQRNGGGPLIAAAVQSGSDDLGIGSADIGDIGGLTALLELGGEDGDGDGNQDGDDRDDDQQLGQGEALFVHLLHLVRFTPHLILGASRTAVVRVQQQHM